MRSRIAALVGTCLVAAAACATTDTEPSSTLSAEPSGGGSGGDVRTIEVFASDAFRFEPDVIGIQAGERIKFVVTNRGSLAHEFYVADEPAQEQHAREAAGGINHDSANGVFLEPGEIKELETRFDSPDALIAGCHVSGHYAAGMIATILVE